MLRNADATDAAFILGLRTYLQKAQYLSYTPFDLERQRAWLESYATKKDQAHFDVRKENEHVWRFHERFGSMRILETDRDYFYQIDSVAIAKSRMKYRKFLPNPIQVKEQ
ncbi:hypothetical protein [Halothiobacillus sp.]|uniref:hypothetical protein n=1 Tax=Halothiobacillus sp. TaxID=1891311 RepID=UPI0026134018|nr:hypothetical protein [Halothiobacillus sp.]MDD3575818.1 hypothetical protein [Halothiobacillus sp.]MDD4967261.1 hypothetical protein [Halothiobacillus sp.]